MDFQGPQEQRERRQKIPRHPEGRRLPHSDPRPLSRQLWPMTAARHTPVCLTHPQDPQPCPGGRGQPRGQDQRASLWEPRLFQSSPPPGTDRAWAPPHGPRLPEASGLGLDRAKARGISRCLQTTKVINCRERGHRVRVQGRETLGRQKRGDEEDARSGRCSAQWEVRLETGDRRRASHTPPAPAPTVPHSGEPQPTPKTPWEQTCRGLRPHHGPAPVHSRTYTRFTRRAPSEQNGPSTQGPVPCWAHRGSPHFSLRVPPESTAGWAPHGVHSASELSTRPLRPLREVLVSRS